MSWLVRLSTTVATWLHIGWLDRLASSQRLGPGLRIVLALIALLLSVVGGGFFLWFFEDPKEQLSLSNAVWLALITTTTVGYGDITPHSTGARLVTVVILSLGFLSVSVATASFVELLVEGGIARMLGRRSLESRIAGLEGHYIICGYGRMGRMICREISQRVPIVVIEKNEDELRRLEEDGYLYLYGDATEEEVLARAGIERARGLVSVVASDAENVFIVLTAREMSRSLYILARSVDESSERKLRRAGANKVISPYLIGGLRLAQAIIKPTVVDFLEFIMLNDSLDVRVEEMPISEGSALADCRLVNSGISAQNIIVLAIKRQHGRMEFNPSRDTAIKAGDTLIVLGPAKGMEVLEQKACQRAKPPAVP